MPSQRKLRGALVACTGLGLAVFAARRILFVLAVLTSRSRDVTPEGQHEDTGDQSKAHTVAIVVAAHDEATALERSLPSLASALAANQHVVLVSDGSSDQTLAIMERWAAAEPGWKAMELPSNVGKGAALNAAVAASGDSELIVVCDADVRVAPDFLGRLLRPFGDSRVGAVSALLWPANCDQSIVSRYCSLELWQHQLVSSAAKDRLGLGPPAHGWLACYRRKALARAGGFPAASLGEDVVASNRLLGAGWSTRFVPSAVAFGEVPQTLREYWHQHVRWSRSLHDGAAAVLGTASGSPVQRAEIALHAAGYLDRALLAGAAGMAAAGRLSYVVPAGYGALLLGEALISLALAARLRAAPRFLIAALAMAPVDVAASLTGSAAHLLRLQRRWGPKARRPPGRASGSLPHSTRCPTCSRSSASPRS